MAIFKYHARDKKGQKQEGQIDASSEEAVATQLLSQGVIPIQIQQIKSKKTSSIWQKELIPKRVKLEELIAFCRQMYSLLKSGVPIVTAVGHIEKTVRSRVLSVALSQIESDISAGKSLSVSLSKHPKIFSPIFVNMIDAAENSGQLEEAFNQVSIYINLEAMTKKRIKSATRYPIIVISVLLVAFIIVNFFVVPAFTQLYNQFSGQLPLITRLLMGISNFLIRYWYLVLVAVGLLVFLLISFVRSKSGGFMWDHFKLKMYVFGPIIRRILLGRFARVFAMMLKSGVPVTQSLSLVANTMDNQFIKKKLYEMADGVEKGMSLTKMATRADLFPPLVIQMLSVGEESGAVDSLLQEVADYYEREVDYDLARLSDLIEPILLAIMGVLVLFFALAVFLPIWDMINFIRR